MMSYCMHRCLSAKFEKSRMPLQHAEFIVVVLVLLLVIGNAALILRKSTSTPDELESSLHRKHRTGRLQDDKLRRGTKHQFSDL